jgi:hypothetical protein
MHVLQGIALGYQTQVFRLSFFTFVVSAAATSPSTRVLGLVAAALTTTTPIVLPSYCVDSNIDNASQEPANVQMHHVFMTAP